MGLPDYHVCLTMHLIFGFGTGFPHRGMAIRLAAPGPIAPEPRRLEDISGGWSDDMGKCLVSAHISYMMTLCTKTLLQKMKRSVAKMVGFHTHTLCKGYFRISRFETTWNNAVIVNPRMNHHVYQPSVGRLTLSRFWGHVPYHQPQHPNYLMMGGWHDDVVDMMVRMLTMTIVRNSEVF